MDINKETIKLARRVPTPAAHRAVQAALGVLDMQPTRKPAPLPRWAVAAAAAVAAVALVAAVPPLRDGAVNLTLDALGRAVPQTDCVNPAAGGRETPNPSAPAATARTDSVFLRYKDSTFVADGENGTVYPLYYLAALASSVINASQTDNGVTATVEEAALVNSHLILSIRFDTLAGVKLPESTKYSVSISGLNGIGNISVDGPLTDNRLLPDEVYPSGSVKIGETYTVHTAISIYQYTRDGKRNEMLFARFVMDFDVTAQQISLDKLTTKESTVPTPAPTAAVTEAFTTEVPQATAAAVTIAPSARPAPETTAAATVAPLASPAPDTTALPVAMPAITWVPPAQGGLNTDSLPAASANLPEPTGATYAAFTEQTTGVGFEVPDTLVQGDDSWMKGSLADGGVLLQGWILPGEKGGSDFLGLFASKYDVQANLMKTADRVARQWPGVVNGQYYTVDKHQVCLMQDEKGQLSCIVMLPPKPIQFKGKTYDTLTLWGTPEYVNHALKTMKLNFPQTK